MNAEQIELIQQSFQQLRRSADTVALLFYEHLFTEKPALKQLFHSDMEEQGRKLMNLLGVVVVGLPQLERLTPMLRELGARHARYGVQTADYDTVANALLWTLEHSLPGEYTPAVQAAWTEAYRVLARLMQDGAREALAAHGLPA
ncbi:globin family protein [Caldimonas tepidiphila]|uniref:globin family protein n=1 Tax=Caldimonas tepidiphila TaxID=2315841 RepID=UPI0013004F35|nr:globin family protein [Caldimonas tepidiphila]